MVHVHQPHSCETLRSMTAHKWPGLMQEVPCVKRGNDLPASVFYEASISDSSLTSSYGLINSKLLGETAHVR